MGEELEESGSAADETGTPTNGGSLSDQEKTWGLIAHLCPLIGFAIPFGNLIAPLLVWQTKKDELPFAAGEAKEVLNMQICVTIVGLIVSVLTFAFLGPIISVIIGVTVVVFMVIAALKVKEGISYRYPYIFRLIK